MLFPLNLNEHLINEEGVTISLMLPSQSLGIYRSKLITPKADSLITDLDAPLGHQVFDVAVTQVETMVQPHGILNDLGWESVALIHFGLCHEIDPDRLALNLSVPLFLMESVSYN